MTHNPECFVGIDISKNTLDVALLPSRQCWQVVHDEKGIEALAGRLQQLNPTLVVMEATGGLETQLVGAYPVCPK